MRFAFKKSVVEKDPHMLKHVPSFNYVLTAPCSRCRGRPWGEKVSVCDVCVHACPSGLCSPQRALCRTGYGVRQTWTPALVPPGSAPVQRGRGAPAGWLGGVVQGEGTGPGGYACPVLLAQLPRAWPLLTGVQLS